MRGDKFFKRFECYCCRPIALALVFFFMLGSSASAIEINTGNEDLGLRWDNTLRYNYGVRAKTQNEGILKNPNMDDGNRNFDKGTVTNRLDLLSELDFRYKQVHGVRFSGAFWYDQRYNDPMGNDSVATSNHIENGKQTLGFSNPSKRWFKGPDGELLDAFAFTQLNLGPVPVNIKAGRHTLYWGESLLPGGGLNGISYSQFPIDMAKALSVPGAEVKELFRPLAAVSVQAQLTDTLSLAGQQFFQWEPYRVPEPGTYLSGADMVLNGGEALIVGPGVFFSRGNDVEPDGMKNWGVAMRWSPGWLGGTAGLYYRKFADMLPQVNLLPVQGQYFFSYGNDIDLYGASLSTKIFGVSVGAELSYRKNMPLASDPVVILPGQPLPDKGDTFGARGDTWHGVLNFLSLIGETPLFNQANILVEFCWNRWDKVSQGSQYFKGRDGYDAIDAVTKDAYGVGLSLTPTWFQVFPGMDLSMPLSYSTGLSGNSAVGAMNENAGNWSAGLSLDVYQKYNFTLAYIGYFGDVSTDPLTGMVTVANGTLAGLKDRDWVSFTFKVTF